MKYFLVGVNGSGKTTLASNIKKILPGFEIVKVSEAFMQYLGIDGDYEALRKLSHDESLRRLSELMNILLEKHENLIADSHCLNLVRGRTRKVTGDWIGRFDAFVLVDIDVNTALQRIESDARDRALFPEDLNEAGRVEMYGQYINDYRKEIKLLAEKWQIPIKTIKGEKSADEIVDEFIEFNDKFYENRISK